MSAGRDTDAGKGGDVPPIGNTVGDGETFGEALSKSGFEPAKVGRKRVSQGKPREALKKRPSEESGTAPDNIR
jgi:hypothetical protein